jgi:hypothetical protein
MITSINGKPATWTPEILQEWNAQASGRPAGVVTLANYFTPRTYVDKYNRGDIKTGFVYTVVEHPYAEPQVVYVAWYHDAFGDRVYCDMRVMPPAQYPWANPTSPRAKP